MAHGRAIEASGHPGRRSPAPRRDGPERRRDGSRAAEPRLRAPVHDAAALGDQAEAQSAAREASRLLAFNYRSGTANDLQVLTANAQYLQARLAFIQARAQRLRDTVASFVATGGGWWNAR